MGSVSRTGERVLLRPLEQTDGDRCARWLNDEQVSRYLLSGRFPLSCEREQELLRQFSHSTSDVVFALCTAEGEHIGVCGLHDIDPVDRLATLGIFIGEPQYWGQGLGREACRLLLDYAFWTLNLRRVELSVFDFNRRGLRCYRALGFQEEGRRRSKRYVRGRYRDEIEMALLAEDWEKSAGRPQQEDEQE